jgi:hypothetical protein
MGKSESSMTGGASPGSDSRPATVKPWRVAESCKTRRCLLWRRGRERTAEDVNIVDVK